MKKIKWVYINWIIFRKMVSYQHYLSNKLFCYSFFLHVDFWISSSIQTRSTCRSFSDRVLNTLIYLFISSWLIWCCLLLLAFSTRFIFRYVEFVSIHSRRNSNSGPESGSLMMIIKIWEWRWPATRKMIQNWINRVIAVVDFTHSTLRCPNNGDSSSLNEM